MEYFHLAQSPPGRRLVPFLALAVAATLATGVVGAATIRSTPGGDVRVAATPAAALAAAPAATKRASTLHLVMEFRAQAGGRVTAVRSEGDGNLAAQQSQFVMDTGHVLFSAPLQVRTLGPAGYIEVPANRLALAHGKHWIRLDARALQAQSAGVTPDIGSMLDMLLGLGSPVVTVGRERIGGVTTVHYRTDIAASTALGLQLGGAGGAPLSGLPPVRLDVWLDGAGLPRRVESSISVSGASFSTTFDLSDFGRPVHVVEPAAGDVIDEPSFGAAIALLGARMMAGK